MSTIIPTFLEDLGFTPDSCPEGIATNYLSIDEDHIISRDKVGNIVSRFKDIRWDFSHYVNRQLRINFSKFYDDKAPDGGSVYQDLKLCSLYLLYYPNFKAIRAVDTATRDLFFFAENAISKSISFRESLNDLDALKQIESDVNLTQSVKYRKLANILASYNRLGKLSALFLHFDFSPNKEVYDFALKSSRLFKQNRKINQTPVIPTRLLSELITDCTNILNLTFAETNLAVDGRRLLMHEVVEQLLNGTISICLESPKLKNANQITGIDSIPNKVITARRWALRFSSSQSKYWDALSPFGINHYQDLKAFFGYFFESGRAIIQIFTGMRIEEASNVPYNGFKSEVIEGEQVHFVQSWTTKIESESARFARWFTSEIFADFNKSVQTLVRIFYTKYKGIDINNTEQSLYPLFPAILGQTQTNPFFNYPSFCKFVGGAGWTPYDRFISNPERFMITKEDMAELQRQEPNRDWQGQGFKVGELYPFSSHQFRRSLVVYAARSGLVSLPSLQSNLQHLSKWMTAYYAKGASYADKFILDKKDESKGMKSLKSLVNEFRSEMLDAEVDSIWEEIVETDNILFGAYGSFLQRKKDLGDIPIVFESRSSIRKAVKQGKVAFTKTPLGGCCSVKPCEKAAFTSITACVLCENAVFGNVSAVKLKKTRHNLEVKHSQFSPDSPFAIQIKKEIKAIDTVLNNRENAIEVKNRNA